MTKHTARTLTHNVVEKFQNECQASGDQIMAAICEDWLFGERGTAADRIASAINKSTKAAK